MAAKKSSKKEPDPIPGVRCSRCDEVLTLSVPSWVDYIYVPHENVGDCIRHLRADYNYEIGDLKDEIRQLKDSISDLNTKVRQNT